MKRAVYKISCSLLFLALLALAACGRGGISGSTRLPRQVAIDGIDVSRMTAAEASAALTAYHNDLLQSTAFTLALPGAQLRIPASELGITPDISAAIARAASLRRSDTERNIVTPWIVSKEKAAALASSIASAHSAAPQNARVQTDFSNADPFSFTPAADGYAVGADDVLAALYDAAAARQSCALSVPSDTLAPAVTLSDVQADKRLIAQYTTSYAEYPYNKSNRVHNIQKAAALINGVVLNPGETFDCNQVLGDRTEENGWRAATGIRNATYVTEFGGGVCQVSSTLFNAVLMADLTITERHPHSWPMGYVDVGRDATISTGGKNLIFVNSTGGKLYLSAFTDDEQDTITVSLYGVPLPDGQYIEISSELISRLPDEGVEIQLDESLAANTRVVLRESRAGCVSRTYQSYYAADGTLLRRALAYEDTYRSIRGITYVSPDIYYS